LAQLHVVSSVDDFEERVQALLLESTPEQAELSAIALAKEIKVTEA